MFMFDDVCTMLSHAGQIKGQPCVWLQIQLVTALTIDYAMSPAAAHTAQQGGGGGVRGWGGGGRVGRAAV